MASNVLQLHPPYQPFFLYHEKILCSLSYSSARPQKIPSSSLCIQKNNIFSPSYVGFFLVLFVLVRVMQRKQGESQNILASYLFILSLYLFPFSHSILVLLFRSKSREMLCGRSWSRTPAGSGWWPEEKDKETLW